MYIYIYTHTHIHIYRYTEIDTIFPLNGKYKKLIKYTCIYHIQSIT